MNLRYTTENVFHLGIIVPDIERGMEEIASRFEVTFPAHMPAQIRARVKGVEMELSSRFVYSRQGPPYLELIQAVPGTVWDVPAGTSRIHHIGIFVDDLEAEVQRLTNAGYELELAALGPDGRPGAISYINTDLGVRQELVSMAARDAILGLTKL
jgi:catechol 2,3-dioxygenase-like lactoylglutathione lyase family enzyme